MGEDQWFQPVVRNRLPSKTIILAHFTIYYGKFYNINDRFNETESAQGTKIKSKEQFQWGHCGRQSSPTGTEGTFQVLLEDSGEKIAEIYWSCPYIGSNELQKRYVKEGYDICFNGFSIPSGVLGEGRINVRED